MLTVEQYCRIRIAHRDWMSIRQLARRFNHSRRKVRRALAESEQAPHEQQHTAARLYRRLRDKRSYARGEWIVQPQH